MEFERNSPIEPSDLLEFFSRTGWDEPDAVKKLEWVLAASEEWVVCRLDGEMIGFGRSCRLSPTRRMVFDVVIDARFQGRGLEREIVRLLSENVGGLEEVSVFLRPGDQVLASPREDVDPWLGYPPLAPPGAYLGRQNRKTGGWE